MRTPLTQPVWSRPYPLFQLERTYRDPPVQLPGQALKCLVWGLLNTGRLGAQAPLCSVFDHSLCKKMLPEKEPFPCNLSLDTREKSSAPPCALPLPRKLQRPMRSHPSFLFSKLDKPGGLVVWGFLERIIYQKETMAFITNGYNLKLG